MTTHHTAYPIHDPITAVGLADCRRPLRVLLVEDDSFLLALGHVLLAAWEIDLYVARDGQAAVEAVAEHYFDIVLMDLQMPVMDGFETVVKLRAFEADHPWRARVPVIAYTSMPGDDVTKRLRAGGFDGLLRKPALHPAMGRLLHDWCAELVVPRPGGDCGRDADLRPEDLPVRFWR